MSQIFHSGIFEPLYNTLVFLYNTIPGQDLGIAIIVLTVATKAIMLPLSKKQIESQKHMQELQPQIKEIQKKYKENKEKQTKELMKFYKEHKVNPLSGCLPIIVQLIVLIGVYQILLTLSRENLMVNGENLYAFIQNPGQINHMFIGLIDLAKPSIVLAVMAAVGQYYQVKMMLQKKAVADEKKKEKIVKKEEKETEAPDFAQMMNKQMLYLMPVLTLVIGSTFAAGLALYWLASTLFTIAQQYYIIVREK